MEVRTAVIPAAGWGTRMLPASKAVPKNLLPLVDRPMIHYIVEEAVQAGLTRIILVTSPGKDALADYFSPAPELEAFLRDKGRSPLLAPVQRLMDAAEFSTVPQEEQLGLGHAVLTARHAVGDEPFAVLLPDDLILDDAPAIGRLLAVARERQASVVAVEEVPMERISAYGAIEPRAVAEGLYQVLGLVEKPPPDEAPSNLGIVGRYVLTPEVFAALEQLQPGAGGEIQLTDGLSRLLESQGVYAHRLHGTRYDAGNPVGLLQAAVALALRREEMGSQVREVLNKELGYPGQG